MTRPAEGRRLARRVALALLALLLAGPAATASAAQGVPLSPPEPPDAPDADGAAADGGSGLRLFSSFDFHLSMAHLADANEQFVWDADYGGDVDLIDYGLGRVNFLANFEAILGEELRRFDPNQGNYTLDVSGSVRLGALELAGVFHHVSRHLSDRPKLVPIDWNMVGLRAYRPVVLGRTRVLAHARALWTVKRSAVDYRAEYGGGASLRHPVHSRVAVIASGDVVAMPVARTVFTNRDTQVGGRLEGGLRVEGAGAALEFFAGVERRIDARPLEPGARTWGMVGFRLLSR